MVSKWKKFLSVAMSFVLCFALTPSVAFAAGETYDNAIITQEGELVFFKASSSYTDGSSYNQLVQDVNGKQYTGKVVTQRFNSFIKAATDTSAVWLGQGPITDPKNYGMLNGSEEDALKVVKITAGAGNPSFKSLYSIFNGLTNLKTVDLTGADLSGVNRMAYAFNNCPNLETVKINASTTSSLNTMSYMFNGCESLTSVDLRVSNASGVTDMDHMFDGCSALTTLDLSKVGVTSNLRSAEGIFSGCVNLATLNISNMNTLNKISTAEFPETNFNDFFKDCKKLVSITFNNGNIFSTTNGKGGYIEFPYGFWTNKNAGSSYSYNTMSDGSSNTILRDTYTRANNVGTDFTYENIETGLDYTGDDYSDYIRNAIANNTTYSSSVLSTKRSNTWEWSQDYYDITLEGDFINANKAAVVTVTGKEYLTGTKTFTVNINQADLSLAEAETIEDQNYTGQQIKPVPVLTFNNKPLVENTDYTLEYFKNTNQTNSAQITATAVDGGNFISGTKKNVYFKILKIDGEHQYSDTIEYTKTNGDNTKTTWKVSGSNLYIDNNQVLGSISGISIEDYDASGVLVKSSTASYIPNNVEVIVTNDGEGRPYMFSGNNMHWSVKTKEADGYKIVTSAAESGATLEVKSDESDTQVITGNQIVINKTLDANEIETDVERIYTNDDSKQIQIFRGTAIDSTINKNGTVDVTNWTRKISEDVTNNKITLLKIESYKHGNQMFTTLITGDNINFSENSATASGIVRIEETNKDGVTRTLNSSSKDMTLSSIFDDAMDVTNVLTTTAFDSDGNEVEVYKSDAPMKAQVLYDGTITSVKLVSNNETVEKYTHPVAITFEQEEYTYTGSEIKPKITVKIDGSDEELDKKLYTVSYSDNTDCTEDAKVNIKYEFDGNTIEGSGTFKIVKADNDNFTSSAEKVSLTYKVAEETASKPISYEGNTGDVTYNSASDDHFSIDTDGSLVVTGDPEVGTYTLSVSLTDAGDNNHNPKTITQDVEIEVGKAENETFDVEVNDAEFVYGEEDVDKTLLTMTGVIGSTHIVKTASSSNYFSIGEDAKLQIEGTPGAGTYTMDVTVTDSGDDNHKSKSIDKTITIKVAEAENDTFTATANNIKFNYGASSVSTKPISYEGNYGDISYSKVGGSTYFDIDQNGYLKIIGTPSAGTYTVNIATTDSGGQNHKSKTINNDVNITVEKASSGFTPTPVVTPTFSATANNIEMNYGDTTQKKLINVSNNYGTVSYVKTSGDSHFDVDSNGFLVITGTPDVGTYTLTIVSTDSGDSNHSSKSVTNSVRISVKKINNMNLSVTDKNVNIPYDTTGNTGVVAFSVTGNNGDVTYKKTSGSTYFDITTDGNIVISGTPTIGSYTIDVAVTDAGNTNNNSTTINKQANINIVKAENSTFKTIINDPKYVYNNYNISEKVVNVDGVLGDVTYEKISGADNFKIDQEGYLEITGIPAVGTYTITVTTKDSGDIYHNEKTITDKVNITISKATNASFKMSPVNASVVYASTPNAKIVKTSGNLGKITYGKVSGSNYFSIDKNGKLTVSGTPKVGTYRINVYAKDAGNSSYLASKIQGTVVIKVTKAANKMAAKAKTVKLKKSNKAQKIAKKTAFAISGNNGKVTFAKVTKGSSNKLSITKNGVIKVKAKAKGTLKLKVKITAAGNGNYKAKTVTRTVKVKIS